MRDTNLVNALREHAEWAEGNQWETPITLGDDLAEAADRIANQSTHIAALQKEIEKLRAQLRHLGKLAEADKDGRLVVLPCKVGDTVWVTRNPWTGKLLKKPLDAYVNGMKMYSHGLYVNLLFDTRKINGTRDYEINHIGKTVFLTREEADAALEAMKK